MATIDSGRWQTGLGLNLHPHWEAEQFCSHTAPLARQEGSGTLPPLPGTAPSEGGFCISGTNTALGFGRDSPKTQVVRF